MPDGDLDGVPSSGYEETCSGSTAECVDNCPDEPNPEQGDWDGDLVGDACDDCAEYQPIDGVTPALPGLWAWESEGSCPEDNFSFGAKTTPIGESAIELSSVREFDCSKGTTSIFLSPTRDYFGLSTVIEMDVGWEASVLPFEFLGTSLARITVSDGETELTVFTQPALKGDSDCGKPAVMPAGDERSVWRFEFSHTGGLRLLRDGVELDESPFNLLALVAHWRIGFHLLSGDLAGDCGALARIRIYSYEHVCEP